MYNTVMFDLDGTLIDSDHHNMMSLKQAVLVAEGRDLPMEMVKATSGAPAHICMEMLNVVKVEETIKAWDQAFFESKGRADFFDGVEEMVAALNEKGVVTGIVTSRKRDEHDAFFSHLNLFDMFQCIVFSSDTELHKPNPEPLNKFLELTNRSKTDAIYIGDTSYDRDAAMNAGIDFALAGWSLHDVPCEKVIMHPKDILNMV